MQPTDDKPRAPVASGGSGAMTEDAAEWMHFLTAQGARMLRVLAPADMVNGMMAATVSTALGYMPHKELSAWLRRIAKEVDAECAERKPS